MSLIPIDISKATGLVNKSAGSKTTFINFHDLFGVENCLLDCPNRKCIQTLSSKKRGERLQKSSNVQEIKGKKQKDSFTMKELTESVSSGCGSCKMILSILDTVLPKNKSKQPEKDPSPKFYSVSSSFTISEESTNTTDVESRRIQLFAPKGSYPLQFECMPISDFLFGNSKCKSLERASTWLADCTAHHDCPPTSTAELPSLSHQDINPSRLIDVTIIEKDGIMGIKLIEPVTDRLERYACLSHCWGEKPPTVLTTKSTIDKFKEFISLDSLPANFRDAILIARTLNIQFVWIDSLCIIQGDKDDWDKESVKMASIYQSAYLTIAAVWASDSSGGCFRKDMSPDLCLSLDHEDSTEDPYLVGVRIGDGKSTLLTNMDQVKGRFPLFTRGWVFQERLLSPRMLYCNYGEFTFQCLANVTCECQSASIIPHPWPGSKQNVKFAIKRSHLMHMSRAPEFNKGSSHLRWREMVIDYMALDLTYQTDILPAISGCARAMSELTGSKYIAGMWERTLLTDMLWFNAAGANGHAKARHILWTAPSWSWASIPSGQTIQFVGLVSLQRSDINTICYSIKEVQCEVSGANLWGTLKSGYIRMDAFFFPCSIRRFCRKKHSSRSNLRKRKFDIHYSRPGYKNECKTNVAPLDAQGAHVSFIPDSYLPWENLTFHIVPECIDNPENQKCRLSQVYLLRMAQRVHSDQCTDFFMILKQVDEDHRIYNRIGLMVLGEHATEQRSKWFEQVWNPSLLPQREITLK